MKKLELSFSCRKALSVHIGETAASEIIDFLEQLDRRLELLERAAAEGGQVVSTLPAHETTQPRPKAA